MLHLLRPAAILLLLAATLGAGEAAAPAAISASKALTLAKKFLASGDAAAKAAILAEIGEAPVANPSPLVGLLAPTSYPAQKPGVRHGVALSLPASISDKPGSYSIGLPPNYAPNRLWPLIIGLHGGGDGQGSGQDQYRQWPDIVEAGAIFACPTSLDLGNDLYWRNPRNEEMLIHLIRTLMQEYPIDPDRVYLVGYSMGGIGTYYIGPRLKGMLAGIGPGAGSWHAIYWPGLVNLPVYILHGKRDMRGPLATNFPNAEQANDFLSKLGYAVEFRAVDATHTEGWPRGEGKRMAEWLLKHPRDPLAKHVILASPCARDFRAPEAPARPDRWLAIESIGDAKLPLEGLKIGSGGAERTTISLAMGTLDATWSAANRLEVQAVNVRRFRVGIHPKLVNLKKPVTIAVNGAEVFSGLVPTRLASLLTSLDERRDPSVWFINELAVDVPAVKPATP